MSESKYTVKVKHVTEDFDSDYFDSDYFCTASSGAKYTVKGYMS